MIRYYCVGLDVFSVIGVSGWLMLNSRWLWPFNNFLAILLNSTPIATTSLDIAIRWSANTGIWLKLLKCSRDSPTDPQLAMVLWLVHTADADETKLSCLVANCVHTADKTVLSRLDPVSNLHSVAARRCLPPGANVYIAAKTNEVSSVIRVFSRF